MNAARSIITLLILFLFGTLMGQESRPKIGLVLSGGGAKGLAHIGVLKVLEEQGIYPDYITGTSMGSIIGGLYAIGYSPHELDSLVSVTNWALLLSDGIPLSNVSPEEKDDYDRFLAEFNVNKQGLTIPSGMIKGQQISQLISKLSWSVADIHSFSDYPIPFKCVAADLISGNQYVFSQGNFTTALRASMSIPSIFEPVKLDTMLLVDGGVLNNFPVKLCKEMGADIIIGVNVGFKKESQENELNSLTDILAASASIGSNLLMKQAIKYTDLLISPDLGPYNTGSFFDAPKIIELGEIAARQKLDEIKALIDANHLKPTYPKGTRRQHKEKLFVSEIQVTGLKNTNKQFFYANLGIKAPDTISTHDLELGLKRLMGTRYFENVTYQLTPLTDSYLLHLTAEESARVKAKFSIHYDNEYKAGLKTNLTLRNILAKGSRAAITADISETPDLTASFINFFGEKQRTAGRFGLTFENNNFPVYLNDGSKYGTFKQYYLSLRAGFMTLMGTKWQTDAYLNYKTSTLQNKSGFSEVFYAGVKHFGNSFLSANFDLNYNSLDSRYFPQRGSKLTLNYLLSLDISPIYRGSSDGRAKVASLIESPYTKYFTASAHYWKYFSLHPRLTSGLRLSGTFVSRSAPFLGLTYIGGLPFNNRGHEVSFIGYDFREKLAEDYALGEISLRYKLLNNIHFSTLFNALYSNVHLKEEIEPIGLDKAKQVYGYGIIMAYDSILGPLQMGMGSNNSDNRLRWFFNFGFTF